MIDLSPSNVLIDDILPILTDQNDLNAIKLEINVPAGIDLNEVKSIALYEEGTRYAYIVKNVDKLPDDRKLDSWWIYPIYSE